VVGLEPHSQKEQALRGARSFINEISAQGLGMNICYNSNNSLNEMNEEKHIEIKEKLGSRLTALVVVLAFIFGSLGGYFGALKAVKQPGGLSLTASQAITLQEDSAIIDVVKKAGPAVVSIIVTQDVSKYMSNNDFFSPFFGFDGESGVPDFQRTGSGSGFFVSADGIILTNKHVVSDNSAKYTVITQDKKQYEAKVLALDPRNDLAIVKVDIKDAPFLKLADTSGLQIGQRVVAIGNSLGQYPNTVTSGIISGIGRRIVAGGGSGSEELSGVIQTDAAINPGNSGGPLLDVTGAVVGINTAVDRQGESVGFAIPASDASKALGTYQKNGKITRPFLGVRYVSVTPELAKAQSLPKDYGALVVRGTEVTDLAVVPGSPADKAGVSENDILLEVDGKRIDEENSLGNLLRDKQVGDSVNIKIYHRGEEKVVKVVLEEAK